MATVGGYPEIFITGSELSPELSYHTRARECLCTSLTKTRSAFFLVHEANHPFPYFTVENIYTARKPVASGNRGSTRASDTQPLKKKCPQGTPHTVALVVAVVKLVQNVPVQV